jgi:hypothetical protein
MDFIDFVTSLAPEGETVLFVQQKKKRGYRNCRARRAPSKAWYVSSGSFILDRMTEGVGQHRNCTHVTFLAVDDVGTKSKVPPLPPTWIIETSPGNYQWAWVLSEQVPVAVAGAAERAFAEAGYTDGGAINPVRNWRIPRFDQHQAGPQPLRRRLDRVPPRARVHLEQICAALGVTPAEADTATARRVALDDDGTDDVLAWLSEAGHLTAQGNAAGWWGVVCPNTRPHHGRDRGPLHAGQPRLHLSPRPLCGVEQRPLSGLGGRAGGPGAHYGPARRTARRRDGHHAG